jgi:hypothetical protein
MHLSGREAVYDFTNCSELGSGAPFEHLLFELVLSFSGGRWPAVALSPSYEAHALRARLLTRTNEEPNDYNRS